MVDFKCESIHLECRIYFTYLLMRIGTVGRKYRLVFVLKSHFDRRCRSTLVVLGYF